jgi:hypothetical protein
MRVLSVASWSLLLSFAVTAPAFAGDWVRSESEAYGFSADFPGKPSQESSATGGVPMHSMSAGNVKALCLVVRGDYPYTVDPEIELPASRDSFVKGMSATLTSSKRITFKRGDKTLAAMEFDAASATHNLRSIIVIDGTYAYQVAGAVSKKDGDPKNLERCVRGFALTP